MKQLFSNKINNRLKRIFVRARNRCSRQDGFGLVEALLAVAILGSTVYLFIGGMYTGTVSIGRLDQQNMAENLARAQFEYTKSAVYRVAPFNYPSIDDVPDEYSITTVASEVPGKDTLIQKIVVTVYRNAEAIYTLEGYKVWR